MTLQKQIVTLPLSQGIDTKTDPKQVAFGKLLLLQNGIQIAPGEINKRYGFLGLTQVTVSGSSISAAVGIYAYKGGLTLAEGYRFFSYSPTATTWGPQLGNVVPVSVQTSPVYQPSFFAPSSWDSAVHSSGLKATVWPDENTANLLKYAITDLATGEKIVVGTSFITTGKYPKVFALGSYFIFTYVDSSTGYLRYVSLPVSALTTLSSPTTVATDVHATHQNYDGYSAGGLLYFTWNTTVPSLKTCYLTTGLALSGTISKFDNADTCIAVFADQGTNVWVVYGTGASSVRGVVYNSNLVSTLYSFTVETYADLVHIGGVGIASGQATLVYDSLNNTTAAYTVRSVTVVGSSPGTPATVARSVTMASKPIFTSGLVLFLAAYDSEVQPTYYLMATSLPSEPVAKIAATTAGGPIAGANLPAITTYGSSFYLAFAEINATFTSPLGGFIVIGIYSAAFTVGTTAPASEIGNNLHVASGIVSGYDGAKPTEHSFHYYPEILEQTATGGGSIGAGTYEYVAVYEWTDGQGQKHRSAPSVPLTVTLGAASSCTLAIPTLRLTSKSGVSIALYRTQANGQVFYRVNVGSLNQIANDMTVDTVSFTDTKADSTIIGQEELYTNGGEVDNGAAPAALACCTFKGRMVVIPAENRLTWWYSKKILPPAPGFPGAPVEFSPLFVQGVAAEGGDLTACVQLDDKLVLFKHASIAVVTGDGPAPNGSGNDYSDAQVIASDVGALSQASVVQTPFGIMFQSASGIRLLARDLSVSYIGADVESYNSDVVTSAVLVSAQNQVRFTMASGVCLVYDYFSKTWATFTGIAAVNACLFQSAYTYVKASGLVLQESSSVFTDNGAFVPLKVKTSWLSLAGLEGFQRIYGANLLGEYKSAHTLAVDVAFDDVSTIDQTITVTPTSTPPYEWGLQFKRQKCRALQLTITESQTPTYGEGLSLSAIALEVGIKGGMNRLPQTSSFS